MKKMAYVFTALVTAFVMLSGGAVQAQTLVDQWGLADYQAWPILNDGTTPAGNGSIGGEVISSWKSLQGGFGEDVTISTESAIIVKGKLEFVGADAGNAYTPLRYAITFQDSNSTLMYQNTDSAEWSHKGNHFGYGFHPRSGAGTMSNGAGGSGTVWTVNNGNWVSTWSNNGGPIASVNQAPRNAELIAGTYDFAISVHAVDDTTNEVRWYLIEENNQYWYGGTAIDTATSDKFNSVLFGVNEVEHTQLNLTEVTYELGDPIEVPEAPWESYYIDLWGLADYQAWPILNDTTTLVGDGTIGGEVVSSWKSLQGGFGQDVSITTEKAVIVRGEIEFVGADAGNAYTPVRYALTYQDSNSTLMYQNTDSAQWSHKGNHFGYGFHPRSGAGTMSNGAGGSGTVWTVNNGNWVSTWSNNGGPIASVNQAPRNAEIIAGTYDFAISVHSVDDVTNEIRWYMVEQTNKYWFGGTAIDTATSKKFNSILFGVNEVEHTAFKAIEMEVDLGAPIEVPEAPWEPYYIDLWGLAEYQAWPILNDSSTLVGDGSIGGDVVSSWKSLQGGFGQDVSITTEKAVIVKGEIEFVGADAGNAYTPFRYALTYQDSNSTLMHQFTDSAQWSHQGNHFGYGFHPRTGAGTMSNGAGGSGTAWTINNGNWASTWSNNGGPIAAVTQAPRNAEIIAGVYDFAISVHSVDDVTNEIRWYMVEKENNYWFGGTVIDTATTKKFNSVLFGVNEVEHTAFKAIEMEVDLGAPIEVPKAPWQDFYVDIWGIYGGNNGGWNLAPGEFVGDVHFNGDAPPEGWAVVRGDFGESFTPEEDVDIFVVTGKITLEGGGFESSASLRFGLFQSDSAGTLDSTETGYNWNGTDNGDTGYLILAQEGSNNSVTWGTGEGNWGRITNDTWYNYGGGTALGDLAPIETAGGAGTYDFAVMVRPLSDGTNKVLWTLEKDDGTYYMEGGAIDDTPVTTFNGLMVGIGDGATATSMSLTFVEATMVDEDIPTDINIESLGSSLPIHFALKQNYPNPFNPSTTIEYSLPRNTEVSLKVFDVTGRLVKELVNGMQNAGHYKITYDASDLSTGLYFFEIRADEFINVKKMMLLK